MPRGFIVRLLTTKRRNAMKKLLLLPLLFVVQLASAQGTHSGIVGQVGIIVCPVVPPDGCPPRPYQATISIFNDKGRLVGRVTTDEEGLFAVNLKPGVYRLVPEGPPPPHTWPFALEQEVRVERKQFSEVTIVYAIGL